MTRTKWWYLQITLADHEANEFRCLGGAGFTKADTLRRFAAIPAVPKAAPDAPFDLVLDLMDSAGDIIDDKHISVQTAAALLGPEFIPDALWVAREPGVEGALAQAATR